LFAASSTGLPTLRNQWATDSSSSVGPTRGINHEDDEVGIANCLFDLPAHFVVEAGSGWLPSTCVDNAKMNSEPICDACMPVT